MDHKNNIPAISKQKSFFSKRQASKAMAITVFALFFLCGMFIFQDYGISPDEDTERRTSLINYIHVMGPAMRASNNEAVRAMAVGAPELAAYDDRYYGTALQSVTVAIEHLFGFQMPTRDI